MSTGGVTHCNRPEDPGIAALIMRIDARFTSVRQVRETLNDCLLSRSLDPSKRDSIILAVSEALNNVCEHAYGGGGNQPIDIRLFHKDSRLTVVVSDLGIALGEYGEIPEGNLPSVDTALSALPEGGFGWFLIRTLADLVHYSRSDGRNRLALTFHLDDAEMAFKSPT